MVRWIGLGARLVVGGVWLWAGLLKVGDPEASVAAVRGYQLLPTGMADTVGHVLPMLEVVLGAALVLGLITRVSGVLSALLQVAFIVGIASVWARGIEINCGCFGDGGPNPDASAQYPWEIARDVGLLALSLLLVWRPTTPYAVDGYLFPEPSEPSEHPNEQVEDVEAES
ncbi:putative membrane protein YphA (DoxX/SURF4 family) [Marmoricola sp. OAE513]|uniref:DoxX family protein n=1 Tax=Marmoricola sp. OAE513 TaxID=2817894 RepID=UPI001AE48843